MKQPMRAAGLILTVVVVSVAGSAAFAEVKFRTVGSGDKTEELRRDLTARPDDAPSVYGSVTRTASEARTAGTAVRSGREVRSAFDSSASTERSGTVTGTASERRMSGLPVKSARGYRTDRGRTLSSDRIRTVTSSPE
jgi:hypothetical protein